MKNTQETDVDLQDFDELAVRIDGIGQALLRVVAELERAQVIDGPRMSALWRDARPEQLAERAQQVASRRVLHQLADLLDDARRHRGARQ